MLANPKQVKEELVEWIQNYFANQGATCTAVVGISGGKDSSVVAALCKEALGRDRVLGVLMPNGEQKDIEDARKLVQYLDIPFMEVNIKEAVQGLVQAITMATGFASIRAQASLSEDSRINMPARIRMTTLYAIGQNIAHGARVANTCNASEDYVGYSTKFGDAAGDFSPLANLVVEEVRQIGMELGLPSTLVEKTPSDGLSGLSDEDKLGFTYEVLDRYIRTGICVDVKVKEKIDYLHRINLHKLETMPSFPYKQ